MTDLVIAPLGSALLGGFLGLLPALKDVSNQLQRNRFRRSVKTAIQGSGLTYADLLHVAESLGQDRKSILQSLRVLLNEALCSDEPKTVEHIDAIRHLLIEHQKTEPFSELPENISLQLSSLSELAPALSHQIGQMAASLSTIYAAHQRKILIQSRLAWAGFIVGVIGVLVGVVPLLK